MNNELRLISKIVRDENIRPALDRGIDASWFVHPEAKMMWEAIIEHWQRYGRTPTVITLKNDLPGCTIYQVDEAYDALLDRFCEFRRNGMTVDLVKEAARLLTEKEDYEAALELLARGVSTIEDMGLPPGQDVDYTRDPESRVERYLSLKDLPGGLLGVPTGFPTIDKATLGLQGGQLVTCVAQPKCGKSTLTEAVAKAVHEHGVTPMLVSFEMSNDEQSRRLDSMFSGIAHRKLMTGDLALFEETRLRNKLAELKRSHPFHLVADPTSTATVSAVLSKVETYNPGAVFIDGVYMMRDEVSGERNTPQALTNITRGLKRLAQRTNLPVWISTQALTWKLGRGRSVTTDSIGYCVDEETEILTERGWRRYDDISVGDRVLTLNHQKGMSEWQAIESVNVFPAMPRKMCLMEGRAHSSLTTPQHRWPVLHHYLRRGEVTREWRTTQTLNSCDYILTAAECADIPEQRTHSDAFVEIMAWFWTEGHINGDYGNVGIAQSWFVNPDNFERIRAALSHEFGAEWVGAIPRDRRNSDGVPRWREHHRRRGLSEFWLSVDAGRALLAHAPGKVPTCDFIRSLTRNQLHMFIAVSMLADRNGDCALSQKSRAAAEMFQFACTLAGINTSLKPTPATKSCPSTMWRVGMRKRQVVTPIASARQNRRFVLDYVDHDGIIWCPTTPNSTWYARRKGNVFITGNSSSFFQDSDVIFGLQHTDEYDETDPSSDNNERLLRLLASRNCGPAEAVLMWDWEQGRFEEYEG